MSTKQKIISIPPFAQCEEEIFSKEKGKCAISKTSLKKGDAVFRFKFSDGSGVRAQYAKKDVFLKTEEYVKPYQKKFLLHKYEISDFLNHSMPVYGYFFNHSIIKDSLTDIKKAMQIIADPPLIPRSYRYLPTDASTYDKYASMITNENATSYDEIFSLLAIYLNCGYADYFLEHLEELPVHAWFLFAMSNDLRFQDKISKKLNIAVNEIFDTLAKNRLTLNDILRIANIVDNHTEFLIHFEKFISIYQAHLNYNIPGHGFTRFKHARNGQFCYLFVQYPNYHPLLERIIRTGEFPSDNHGNFMYIQCFYQRARVIHHLIKKEFDTAIKVASSLEDHIHYYPSGSPKGFIKDTQKMVEQFIKQKGK
jgi:hypothetical protein